MNFRLLPRLAPLVLLCSAFASHAAPVQWVVKDLGTGIDWTTMDTYAGRAQSGVYGSNAYTSNATQASLYDPKTSTHTLLGGLGGTYGFTAGVSNDGRMATGYSNLAGNQSSHAFAYRNGQMSDLGTLGGTWSQGNDINNAGQAVGHSYLNGNGAYHAFLHDGQQMRDLGVLAGDTDSQATRINEAGQVAGYSVGYDAQGNRRSRSFLYSNGQMSDLGSFGGSLTSVRGLNEAGQVVGHSYTAGNADYDAFLYVHGSLINLDSLVGSIGLMDTQSAGFNWDGEVVGWGYNAVGELRYFQLTEVKTQSVPEPTALLLAGSGLLGLALTRRRTPRA